MGQGDAGYAGAQIRALRQHPRFGGRRGLSAGEPFRGARRMVVLLPWRPDDEQASQVLSDITSSCSALHRYRSSLLTKETHTNLGLLPVPLHNLGVYQSLWRHWRMYVAHHSKACRIQRLSTPCCAACCVVVETLNDVANRTRCR